jgi:hypothetical protein
MTFLRTTLVSALLGFATASFAAVSTPTPNDDPAAREARMQEALQHYEAKQAAMNDQGMTKPTKHAKHHRKGMKHDKSKTSQDDNAKAKDQTQ